MKRYPNKLRVAIDDETLLWLEQETTAQHRSLADYVRHIILVYIKAKEAKNKKGV